MREFFRTHKKTQWAAVSVGIVIIIIVLFAVLFDWNLLRPALARAITAKTGRETTIDGDLRVHLLSWNPSADVESIKMRNPDWADHGQMFTAQRVSISVNLLRLLRFQIVLPKVEIIAPTVNLERDLKGRESWEFSNSSGKPPTVDTRTTKVPTIRKLVIEEGKITLDDKIKKLKLTGSIAARERAGEHDAAAFRLKCAGSLNARPFKLEFKGGPLVNITPDEPYSFSATITADQLHVDANASIPKPFDLSEYSAKFKFSGRDLADAYYLTGLALPNTANFEVDATVYHSGTKFRIDSLQGRIGGSDLEGKLEIDTAKERPDFKAQLSSKNLDFSDLAPTLGAPPPARVGGLDSSPGDGSTPGTGVAKVPREKLLPDADLQLNRVRGMDADVTYAAASVTAPKLKVKQVSFHLKLVNGDLKLDPLSFSLAQGQVTGAVDIDARKDLPESNIEMRVHDVDLAQFKSATATQPPISGMMQGRITLHGTGSSIHKFASTTSGGIGVAVPHGEISDAIAELTGINVLRGLGLLVAKDQKQTDIRCGVIDLHAQQGVLQARSVFIDTTNVLITGRGTVQLASEDIDLSLQGDPKKVRLLRLRSPISLHGTLADPSIGIKPGPLAAQVGVAVALGTLLTPVAAAIAFIDPGLAKDKDCVAVAAQQREAIANP